MEATNHIEKTSQHTIPEGWREVSLGELGEVKMCKRVMKHQTLASGEIPFYKIGTFGGTPDAYISRDLFTDFRSRFSYPKKGDILLSAAGTIGRTVVFDGEDSYFQDSNIVWIDNKEDKVLNSLLYYSYKVMKFHTENGGIVVRLYNENLRNTTFCAPESLEEQKRIAEALSAVDNMIATLDEAIAKKRQIKEGLMQQLLTGKTRLPGFYGEWLPKNLGKSALIKARIGWQGLTTKEYLDSGVYYLITGTDFKDGRIDWKNCHYVTRDRFEQDPYIKIQKHDVLVSKDGTIGKVAYLDDIPGPGTLNSGVFVIRSKDKQISQRYLAKVFVSKYFDDFIDSIVAGSTIVHLYQKDIVKFDFMVPPSIEEQEQVCDFLEGVDNEIICLESKRDKYASLKQGMMQELLTGKTRL